MLRDRLNHVGIPVGREHVPTLMRQMDLEEMSEPNASAGIEREGLSSLAVGPVGRWPKQA